MPSARALRLACERGYQFGYRDGTPLASIVYPEYLPKDPFIQRIQRVDEPPVRIATEYVPSVYRAANAFRRPIHSARRIVVQSPELGEIFGAQLRHAPVRRRKPRARRLFAICYRSYIPITTIIANKIPPHGGTLSCGAVDGT